MSTSLLYHGFGVRGYRYVRTDYVEGEVWFSIEQPRDALRCPLCDSGQVIRRGEELRERGVQAGVEAEGQGGRALQDQEHAAEQRVDAGVRPRHARTRGPSIRDDGLKKVLAGVTTLEEVLRVTRDT